MKRDEHEHSGRVFANRYEILNLLGSGGMGSVYFAKDRFLDGSLIAIKILHSQLSSNPEFVERFLREVKAMRLVNHPNVVRNFDTGQHEGDYFYTMECLRGTPLSELIAGYDSENPLPWDTIENMVTQICEGLRAIHAAKLIHRDLKPDNLFLEDDDLIKITDFGVVRMSNSHLTQTHTILGTLDYVAPEIWNGSAPSQQSDIYTLGLVIYELITGTLPFTAQTPAELMKMHLTVKPRPVFQIRPDIPTWVDTIVQKMVAKSLKDRFDTVDSVLRALDGARRNTSGAAGKTSSGSNPVIPSSSRRTLRNDEVPTANEVRSITEHGSSGKPSGSHIRPNSPPAGSIVEFIGGQVEDGSSGANDTVPVAKSGGVHHAIVPTDSMRRLLTAKESSAMRIAILTIALFTILSCLAYPKISHWFGKTSEVTTSRPIGTLKLK